MVEVNKIENTIYVKVRNTNGGHLSVAGSKNSYDTRDPHQTFCQQLLILRAPDEKGARVKIMRCDVRGKPRPDIETNEDVTQILKAFEQARIDPPQVVRQSLVGQLLEQAANECIGRARRVKEVVRQALRLDY